MRLLVTTSINNFVNELRLISQYIFNLFRIVTFLADSIYFMCDQILEHL